MIPLLYDETGSTKIGELNNCIECLVEEERNGIFELRLIYPTTDALFYSLEEEKVIVCNANDTLLNQKFRIYMSRKLMSNRIEVYARHISFDLAYDYIDSIDIENQSCEYALNAIFRNSQFSTHYRGYSDIVNAQSYKMSMANCIEAIAGKEGSIIDTFGTGAEILRDNTNIHVLNKRGHDNSVSIEYRKNLTGFELEEDTSDLVTRILPYAKYTDNESNEEIMVKAGFVDSPLILNYSHPYIAQYDYSNEFEDDEIPTVSKLQELAQKEYRDNKVDIPKQNYKIEFIPLSKCVGYEGLEDKISLCDTVTIKDTRYSIDTQAKVIRTVFDVLKDRYDSMELGEPKTTLGDIIGGSGEDGAVGPPGPQGPPGADGNIGDFPDSLPSTPVLSSKLYGFSNIELSWTYENKVYYNYELYASKTKDFTPNVFDIIHSGQSSSFLFQANPNETWYFRCCAVNTHGNRTEFSSQIAVTTKKIDDLSNYVDDMAINDALIGTLSLDRGWFGQLRGNYIDARQLSVTDGNGKRTLDIDSFGNISMMPTNLKILVDGEEENIATQTILEQTIKGLEVKVSDSGQYNYVSNGQFKNGTTNWGVNGNASLTLNNPYQLYEGTGLMVMCNEANAGIYQLIDTIPGETYSYSFMINSEINVIAGIEDLGSVVYPDAKYTWTRYTGTFTATKTSHAISFYSYHYTGCFYISYIVVAKGEIAPMYLPRPSEFYEGITSIDKNGVTVNQSNINGYAQMSADKFLLNKDGKDLFKMDHEGLYLEGKVKITSGLDGTSTNGEDGRKVTIDKANYTISENNQERAFLGFKNMGNGYDKYVVPKLALGAYGYNLNHNYFTIIPYRGGSDNPQNSSKAYVDIAYHMISHDDYSNIKMYDGGDIRLAPVKDLEITTNYKNAEYKGIEERRLALFTTSTSGYYNGHLQIGAVVNMTNGNGLVLEDSRNGKWVNVHVHVDSTGAKFFRPLENGTTQNGSASFRWDRVFSVNADNVSSDRRLKENIKYLEATPNVNATQSEEYHLQDFYNFVKDDLYLTTYNFIEGDKSVKYGFMAQDLMGTKIGDNIVTSEQAEEGEDTPYLGYDIMNYTHSLAGALKVAIQEIETLKEEIKALKGGA